MNNYHLDMAAKEYEHNTIRQIPMNNKYNPTRMDDTTRKHTDRQDKQDNKDNMDPYRWAKFTYIGKETKFITKLFKNLPIKIACTTNNSIGR